MKSLILLLGVSTLGGAWLAFAPCSPCSIFSRLCCTSGESPAEYAAVQGKYVELRDASVYAGACHVNGESELRGRRALAAWQILAGAFDGQDLTGLEVVAAIESEANLAGGGARRAIVYLPETCEVARGEAALGWLRASHGAALGEIVAVHSVPVDVSFEGDAFELEVADVARASGSAFTDRRCCSMPSMVAYQPLSRLQTQACGNTSEASFAGQAGLTAWSWPEQNNAFVGSFRWVQPDDDAGCCPSLPARCEIETGTPSE